MPTNVPRNIRPSVIVIRKVERNKHLRRKTDAVMRCVDGEETVEDWGDEGVEEDMVGA